MNPGHQITSSWLLNNLNTYINEDQISSEILDLRRKIHKIESASGPSLRTIKMHNEIKKLTDQLIYCKDQSSLRTLQYRQANPEIEE